MQLPAVSIDHPGMSRSGFAHLFRLAEKGVKAIANGFGRIDFDASRAMVELYKANFNRICDFKSEGALLPGAGCQRQRRSDPRGVRRPPGQAPATEQGTVVKRRRISV